MADLTVVILNWGACGGAAQPSLAEEIEGAGLVYPDDWEEFLNYIDDENYRCWMNHYLTSPCGPLCPEGPDCPDDDPWGSY